MSEDTYNGWANRETWLANLHLANDQGLYSYTLEAVAGYIAGRREVGEPPWPHQVGDFLKDHVEHGLVGERLDTLTRAEATQDQHGYPRARLRQGAPDDPVFYLITDLIGTCLGRVDWEEVAEHWLPEDVSFDQLRQEAQEAFDRQYPPRGEGA